MARCSDLGDHDGGGDENTSRGRDWRVGAAWIVVLLALHLGLVILASPCQAEGGVLNGDKIVTLLHTRGSIEQDTLLLDRRLAPEIGGGRILARLTNHGHYRNITLVYAGPQGETVLFEEMGAGAELDWIETVRYIVPGVLLVRTRYQSTGATGDGTTVYTVRVCLFDPAGLTRAESFDTYDNGEPFARRVEVDWDTDVVLILRAFGRLDLYRIDREARSLDHQGSESITWAPSFDCARAATAVETTICFSPALSALDSIQADLYQQIRSTPGVVARQRAWLADRDQCLERSGRDGLLRACLAQKYQQRIRALRLAGQAES